MAHLVLQKSNDAGEANERFMYVTCPGPLPRSKFYVQVLHPICSGFSQ